MTDFAYTAESELAAQRHAGVRRALELIHDGHPQHAHFVLLRSLGRQLRIAGIRTSPVDTTRP